MCIALSSGGDSESGTNKSGVQGSGVDVGESNDNDAPRTCVLSSLVAVVSTGGGDGNGDGEDIGLLRVPERVRPVAVCLQVAKDEEFVQAEINHPRRNLVSGPPGKDDSLHLPQR